jgi:ubiquinone/menaquinone biosynthesis C-methylase UbiE
MPYRQTISEAYDAGVEEEYNRLTESPLREAEYQLIIELLDEYIPCGSVVIDIGSGPGRYAEHLLKRNCKVGLIDLSAKSLKAFSDRIGDSCNSNNIMFNRVSCATQLNWVADSSADAILLMGPLYHLVIEEHRNLTLENCKRILKPNGLLFTVFLSPFPDGNRGLETITNTRFKGFDVPQFRCMPDEAKKIMSSNSFETLRIRNIEGIASFIPDEKLNEIITPEKKSIFLNTLRKTSEKEELIGITHQYFVISSSSKVI